jgi:hypothetical protein
LIASLLLVDLADEWFTFLPAGAMESIRADLGLSYAQAGVLLALLPAGGLLGVVLMAAADFVSRRVLGAGGAFVFALCLLAFAAGRSFLALAVASFVWGAASDAFVHATQLALAEIAGDDLDATLSRTNLLGSLGEPLGPLTLAVAAGASRLAPPLRHGRCADAGLRGVARGPALAAASTGRFDAVVGRPRRRRRRARAAACRDLGAECRARSAVPRVPHRQPRANAPRLGGDGHRAGGFGRRRWHGDVRHACRRPPSVLRTFPFRGRIDCPPDHDRRDGERAMDARGGAGQRRFGAATAVLWVALQFSTFRLRPGQVGTTQAVISGLSTAHIAIPPLIGLVADRLGLATGMWLFVLAPVGILVLALTSQGEKGQEAVRA